MDLELSGQSVLITGGSKGIGRACAEAFAKEGCRVHIASRSKGDLDAVAEAIRACHQTQVTTHAHDLSDSRQVDALFDMENAYVRSALKQRHGASPCRVRVVASGCSWLPLRRWRARSHALQRRADISFKFHILKQAFVIPRRIGRMTLYAWKGRLTHV